jgi:hypothetical protein
MMEDIAQFIESLGALHDATVLELLWLAVPHRLEIEIKDLYWNFEGLPEYPGAVKGRFILSDVSEFTSTVDYAVPGLMIYKWAFKKTGTAKYRCEILFSPNGKLTVNCDQIECRKGG